VIRAPAMLLAVVAVIAKYVLASALSATVAEIPGDHFFILTRRVKLIVRRASFSKPCTRRIERRSARGFATFIRRLRTHLPLPSLAK